MAVGRRCVPKLAIAMIRRDAPRDIDFGDPSMGNLRERRGIVSGSQDTGTSDASHRRVPAGVGRRRGVQCMSEPPDALGAALHDADLRPSSGHEQRRYPARAHGDGCGGTHRVRSSRCSARQGDGAGRGVARSGAREPGIGRRGCRCAAIRRWRIGPGAARSGQRCAAFSAARRRCRSSTPPGPRSSCASSS